MTHNLMPGDVLRFFFVLFIQLLSFQWPSSTLHMLVVFCFFPGYHETFIPTKPRRYIYKGQDLFQRFLVVDRMTLLYYARVV